MTKYRSLSYCEVMEVIAETSAPLTPMGELLKKIPSKRKEVYLSNDSDDTSGCQSVPDSTYSEKEPEQAKPTVATPLSPYIAYEDLKPPTSPIPTPSTSSGATKAIKTEEITPNVTTPVYSSTEVNSTEASNIVVDDISPQDEPKKQNSLSPYSNYEDLKPPSSPTPTPSSGSGTLKANTPEIVPNAAISTSSSIEVSSLETLSIHIDIISPEILSKKPNSLSPYANYEDLKSPSSPTPTPSSSKKEEPSFVQTSAVVVTSQLTGETVMQRVALFLTSLHILRTMTSSPLHHQSPSVPTVSSGNNKPEE